MFGTMIAKATLLFLFGTTLTSAQFNPHMGITLKKLHKSNGCPSGPELAPIICKFMQQNAGLQFKPQLIEPSTYIAPLVVEKCDAPQLDIELPIQSDFKPFVIPEAPVLPPLTIPKFIVPIIVEEPTAPPCESADVPVMPVVNIPAAPEIRPFELNELPQIELKPEPFLNEEAIPEMNWNTIEYHPAVVPQPPELPAFVMPEIPVIESVAAMLAAPCHDEPIPEAIPAYIEPLAPVPDAPKLPEFVMPEPTQVVEPALPIIAAPCLQEEYSLAPSPAYVEPLDPMPAAPELPEFVMPELPIQVIEPELPMPAYPTYTVEPLAPLAAAPELPEVGMPELSRPVFESALPMPAAPCLDDAPALAPLPVYIEPLAPLPAAPELPEFVMPELPMPVVEPALPMPSVPSFENEPFPVPNPVYFETVAALPTAPKLPEFVMPELPAVPVVESALPMFVEPWHEDEHIPAPIPAHVGSFPAAPALQEFVMPDLPMPIVKPALPIPAAPCLEDEPIPVPIPASVEPLAPLPATPESSEFVMPELPVQVLEQKLPMTAAVYLENEHIPFIPIPTYRQPYHYNMVDYQPMPIPQAPELPTKVMAELPEPAAPCHDALLAPIAPVPKYIELVSPVPAFPELPAANLPELPLPVEVPSLEDFAQPKPYIAKEEHVSTPIFMPQAPMMPEIKMPELPDRLAEEPAPCGPSSYMPSPFYQKLFPSLITFYNEKEKETQNILLPSQPIESSAYPNPCVYNLVMKHVMPNMLSNNFRSMENIDIKPAAFLPCS